MLITKRNKIHNLLKAHDCKIGAELGVDRGEFSYILNSKHKFAEFYSIDRWSDHHTPEHYLSVLKKLQKLNVYTLRCTFDEAAPLFEDNYFDFIYIDGYAKYGQENGQTLDIWYDKVKPGGIFSGHDYHEKWQKTKDAVDTFCKKHNKSIQLTTEDSYPTWWFVK